MKYIDIVETSDKYILTGESKLYEGKTLYRIQAVKSFSDVVAGDLGGWIENPWNLSHSGDCWLYNNSMSYDTAFVEGNAKLYGLCEAFGNSIISDNAVLRGSVKCYGHSIVRGNSYVSGKVCIFDNAIIEDNARIEGIIHIYNNAKVYENARVYNTVKLYGNVEVCGTSRVHSNVILQDNVKVCGDANVFGFILLRGDAVLDDSKSYIVFRAWWNGNKNVVWTRSNNMWHVGKFCGTSDALLRKESKDEESRYEYSLLIDYIERCKRSYNA